jgi:hypothetical protein
MMDVDVTIAASREVVGVAPIIVFVYRLLSIGVLIERLSL